VLRPTACRLSWKLKFFDHCRPPSRPNQDIHLLLLISHYSFPLGSFGFSSWCLFPVCLFVRVPGFFRSLLTTQLFRSSPSAWPRRRCQFPFPFSRGYGDPSLFPSARHDACLTWSRWQRLLGNLALFLCSLLSPLLES